LFALLGDSTQSLILLIIGQT